jgi:hypothetical protein
MAASSIVAARLIEISVNLDIPRQEARISQEFRMVVPSRLGLASGLAVVRWLLPKFDP